MKLNYGKRLIYCMPLIIFYISCDSQGHGGISNNIEESTRRNVFIAEYEVIPNPYIINDTLLVKIESAWVEDQWSYGKFENETITTGNEYQLVLKVGSPALRNYGKTWTIGIDGDRYIRSCGTNCLVSDFNELPKNTEEWKVQNGWKLDSFSKKTIIGVFQIKKKN